MNATKRENCSQTMTKAQPSHCEMAELAKEVANLTGQAPGDGSKRVALKRKNSSVSDRHTAKKCHV